MMWIVTIALLLVAAWLFFNALNERRWVQAHQHDETVASDTGLLPSFSASTGSGPSADGRVSIDQESGRFARTVRKVQEKTAGLGDRIERRVQTARVADDQRPASAADEPNFFGRMVARVNERTSRFDERLTERMKASGDAARPGASITEEDSLFARMANRVSARGEAISKARRERDRQRAAERASATFDNPPVAGSEDRGLFDRVVSRVSGGMSRLEDSVDAQLRASRRNANDSGGLDGDDDLLSRVSAKVGQRINEIDEKIVSASKEAGRKIEDTLSDSTSPSGDKGKPE